MKLAMNSKKRLALIKIGLSALAFCALLVAEHLGVFTALGPAGEWVKLGLYLALYAFQGARVVVNAVKSALGGHIFGENMLMSIATIAAFFVGEFHEAVAVMLFFNVGEWFQGYAVGRTRESVSDLMRLREDKARVVRDGAEIITKPTRVKVGEIIVVYPGERIPLDGIVIDGMGAVDVSSLTGESIPCDVGVGDTVLSGSVSMSTILKIKVSKAYRDSTATRILSLIAGAGERKSRAEAFISRFARWYTPAVVIVAVLFATLGGAISQDWNTWIYRALNFLVVSCPCALVVSVPLAFFAGIGALSRKGVLVKGATFVEALARTKTMVFDKTGTLTEGKFSVTAVWPADKREEVLRFATIAETGSSHPIARAIVAEYGMAVEDGYSVQNLGGLGVQADGRHTVLCGSAKLMESKNIAVPAMEERCVVYVAVDGAYMGAVCLSDQIKVGADTALDTLRAGGIHTVMLTGDSAQSASRVATALNIDDVMADKLPDQKLACLESVMERSSLSGATCFVGDGVNDAPSLVRADVGISMGGIGSDAAIEASDVVIMRDELSKLPLAIRLARRTMAVVRQNVVFCLGIKAVALLFSALGITGLWFSVFADVGVAVLAILNSARLLKAK